jgi:hypothetical protein
VPREDLWRVPYATIMVAAVFCSDTPHTHPFALGVVAISLAALAGLWLSFDRSVDRNMLAAGFGLFLLAIVLSLPVAMHNGTTFFDWALRGAAPLSFLSVFFFIRIRTPEDAVFVARVALGACAAWLALVAIDLLPAYRFLPIHRWTIYSAHLLLPYDIAGVAIILFGRKIVSDWIAYPLLLAFFLLAFGGAFRSHVIILGAMVSVFAVLTLYRRQSLMRLSSVVGMLLLALSAYAAIGLVGTGTGSADAAAPSCAFSEQRVARRGLLGGTFSGSAAGDTGRKLETRFALEQFMEAPILGKGLSYPVPSNLIFRGQEDYLKCLESLHDKKYPFVFYLHNLAAYVAMTMGLAGIAAVVLIAAGAISSLFGARIATADDRIAAFAALAGLGLFSLVSAVYTVPQFNLLLASFAAVLAAQTARCGFGARKVPGGGF